MTMKLFFIAVTLSLLTLSAFADREALTDEHRALADQQIKKLGLTPQDIEFKKEDVEIFSSCSNGLWGAGDPEYLIVRFNLKNMKVLNKVPLEKGASVILCDGKVSSIFVIGTHLIDGHKCRNAANFDLQGKLCDCNLAEATVIEGIEIPKGVNVLWRKGKPYAVSVANDSVKIKGRLLEGGYHQFVKGKLKFQKDWEVVNTCGEEIYSR
jgi:hypothetical protein